MTTDETDTLLARLIKVDADAPATLDGAMKTMHLTDDQMQMAYDRLCSTIDPIWRQYVVDGGLSAAPAAVRLRYTIELMNQAMEMYNG